MRALLLCVVLLVFIAVGLEAQVINNTGSAISVAGAVVNTKDLENNAGTLGNNGTIYMNGYLLNYGTVNGSGLYNLKGDWTNYGSFNAGNSTVTLHGTSNQTIRTNSLGESFWNLTINNSGSVITQISLSGGTLGVQKDLILTAGNLNLDPTTSYLNIGGKATVNGVINYNGSTTQTATIVDDFTGSGTFNMGTNDLPHNLNLAGALNSIGTFIPGTGSSTVNYNGTVPTQTVFAHPGYRNLIISNSGVKILQGSSAIGINLTISGGTFDLGTTTTTLTVAGNTAVTGAMSFNTGTAKTVTLNGNLSGSGAIDMNGNALAHNLSLNGFSNSIGSYTSTGSESTVFYTRPGDQSVFTSENYRNLSITGSGVKTLNADISASGILTMSSGDINSNGNTLKVTNSAIAAINRSAGKVIGKLQRAVAVTGSEYLYPLGSSANYNPMKIAFQSLVAGALTAQFQTGYIGNAGLPLYDDGVEGNEIYDTYTTGYWTLSAVGPMSTSGYSVNLNHTGFGIDQSASIIKRTNGGDLELDGTHAGISATEIARTILDDGISATTTDLAIGRGRPRITDQPDNIDICELSNAFFEVTARGRGTLTYQWQVNQGSGWNNITNTGVYSGATTNYLTLTTAPYSMNGYLYRAIITDAQGNSNITNTVLLTVNLIPTAVPTPSSQNECPGVAFTTIALTSYSPTTGGTVPGTTFTWTRNSPAGIVTTLPVSGFATGDMIPGLFTNTLDAPVTVTFTITPKGPGTTFCVGPVSYAYVTVNPTPRVFGTPQNSTQCDSMTTSINLSSPSTFTSGLVTFRYTVTTTGSVSGYVTPTTGMPNGHTIADKLINLTDVYQIVTYRVIPVSPVGCAEGPSQEIKVTVNPTPRVIPVNIKPDICPAGASPTNTQIVLTSPTVMTSGAMRFDYTITKTDGFVIGNTSPETNRIPGYTLSFGYQNNSDTIKSVYYNITPKVDNAICVKGPVVVSEVKVHAKPLQNMIITTPLTCDGGSDAAIRAVTSKGAGLYYYDWIRTSFDQVHGYSIPDITNRRGGRWDVTVTDNLNCKNSSFIFVEGAFLDSYLYVVDTTGFGTTCPGSDDGQIWIKEKNSSTGIAPFKYWIVRDGQDSTMAIKGTLPATEVLQKHFNLLPGNYRLFLKDNNGCYNQTFPEASIIEPEIITVDFGKSIFPGDFNVSCKGYNDGSVWVDTIYGGNKGYRYKWSTSTGIITGIDTLNRLDNITAGVYYLTTTDRKGCSNIHTVTITEPQGMQLASSVLSHSADGNFNISCDGGNDGSIGITITGGSGSYLYSWTSPNGFTASTKDISGLKAGVYTCVVRDVNGCILTISPSNPNPQFTLTDPDPLDITFTPSISADGGYNINCNGGTGSVTTTVTGGSTGNYTYTWSTINGSGIVPGQKDQPALRAGKYYLEVKDLNNCILRDSITLTQPPVFGIQLTATNITCASPGFNNGSVNLTVTGGAGAYSYTWSNGAATEDISGLTQGSYQVTVTYNNVCSKTDAVQINLPPPLTYTKEFTDYNGYNISCFGLSDGAINITPLTGLAPFTYTWTGPDGFTSSSNQISGLKGGSYTLTITDSNYCTATEVIVLTQPGQLGMTTNLSSSIAGGFNINCAGDSTGTIGIEPLNQVKSVQYIWSDGMIGKSRTGLPAGVYTVIITDENNCHATSAITLTQPDSIKLNYTVKQPFCPDKPDGEIRLNVTGGVKGADYIYKWSDNSTGRNVSNILRGFYKMTVTDMNGCQVKDSVVVEPLNETCLIIPNAISPNDDLINDEWNIGMIDLYPQMEIRVFNRWGETVWRSEKGYPRPWDGRSNGANLPVDSYHYIINLHNGSKPIVGSITIVR